MKAVLQRFKETPYELPTAVLAVMYALFALVSPAATNSLEKLVPGWMTAMWCVALLLGGVTTIVGRVGGWIRTELVGQGTICYGIGWYTIGLMIAGSSQSWLAAAVYASFTLGAGARALQLHQALKAREVAQSIVDHQRDGD